MLWRVVLISTLGLLTPGSLTGDESPIPPAHSLAVVGDAHAALRERMAPDGTLPGVDGIVGPLGAPPPAHRQASVLKPDRHNRAAG